MKDAVTRRSTLTPRDHAMTAVESERFHPHSPISIDKVTGIGVPPRIDLVHFEKRYKGIAKRPLSILKSNHNGETEYTVVGPPLTPEDLLAVLDYVSPDKNITANIGEIVEHWDELLLQTDLYEAHERQIPGWADFKNSGKAAIEYLRDNSLGPLHDLYHKDPNDLLIPVFRWRTDRNGKRTIILTPFTPAEKEDIIVASHNDPSALPQLNEAVGLAFLAAYSPVITKEWESQNTYHPRNNTIPGIRKQGIDFIQALTPLTYHHYSQ